MVPAASVQVDSADTSRSWSRLPSAGSVPNTTPAGSPGGRAVAGL